MGYIWQEAAWPDFTYDEKKVDDIHKRYLYAKGMLDSIASALSSSAQTVFLAESISQETLASSAIEGENLPYDSVFSSIMKHLDVDFSMKAKSDKYAEDVSKMVLDAIASDEMPSEERIFQWHHLLFDSMPKGRAPKQIGAYREEPVYVIHWTGRGDQEIVYEAVPAEKVKVEMDKLYQYLREENEPRGIVKSAVASLWFVTIHPFQDGNGRISRALSDCILSVMEKDLKHYFSISEAITKDRKAYYDILERSQKESRTDLTDWIVWYIGLGISAIENAVNTCKRKIRTASIMQKMDPSIFNSRQLHVLYRLVDGTFSGKLTQEKWMKMTKCQSATATRDLATLVEKQILIRIGEGKSVQYLLNPNIEHVLRQQGALLDTF